ncbi:SAM-dependent methyltransferase [Nostoc sp. CHAB 5834]|nr:SAM-dependent methyltransferase [Nostoc sp. CHAB 5834]
MSTPSFPNTGRMVDYWLGGSHHFEVDIEAAKLFEQAYSDFRTFFAQLRDFNGRICRYMQSQGINQFIVFAAGIPKSGNVHEVVPDAGVLYTDVDLTNVQLGQEILADNPYAEYIFCDVTNLKTLNQSVVTKILSPTSPLGIVLVGISAFIPDETLAQTLDNLYDWVPKGSFLALDFDGEAAVDYPKLLQLLQDIGAPLFMRNPTNFLSLLGRWQLTKHGILPVENWQTEVSTDGFEIQEPVFSYGCVVYK